MLVDSAVQPAEPNQIPTHYSHQVLRRLYIVQTDRQNNMPHGKQYLSGEVCVLPLAPRSRALGRLVAYGAQHPLTEGIRKSRAPIQVARPWHPTIEYNT